MEGAILLLLYALSSWGAGLNCPAWSRALVRHLRSPRSQRWWRDDKMLIRIGLTLLSAGVCGLASVRLFGAVLDGEAISVPSPIGVAFIGLMASAEPFFLRVDENHARSLGRRSAIWRLYWAGVASAVILFAAAVICDSI